MFLLPTSFIAIGFAGVGVGITYSEVYREDDTFLACPFVIIPSDYTSPLVPFPSHNLIEIFHIIILGPCLKGEGCNYQLVVNTDTDKSVSSGWATKPHWYSHSFVLWSP